MCKQGAEETVESSYDSYIDAYEFNYFHSSGSSGGSLSHLAVLLSPFPLTG
jgi:hypothetical protein